MGSRAVFLDRDGVLNRSAVIEAYHIRRLRWRTWRFCQVRPKPADRCVPPASKLIVVTNQPDIARGRQKLDVVISINEALRKQVGFDDLYMCLHDDRDQCACRKPRPGMLLAAAAAHDIELGNSVMVGDRDRDIEAGRAVGCRTAFIDQGYGKPPQPPADLTVSSLREAVRWIIMQPLRKVAAS